MMVFASAGEETSLAVNLSRLSSRHAL